MNNNTAERRSDRSIHMRRITTVVGNDEVGYRIHQNGFPGRIVYTDVEEARQAVKAICAGRPVTVLAVL